MTNRAIKAMSSTLRKDIYNLQDYGFRRNDTLPPDPDPLAPIEYS
jgi:hypothetical protein